VAVCLAALVSLFGAPAPFGVVPALAAVIIQVTTTSDDVSPADGGCSLRAAIIAANNADIAGDCPTGTTGQDAIFFNLGSGVPVIDVGLTPLPAITQAVTICGSCGGHGATRVELHGPGSGTGLSVQSGDASVIGTMRVDGFTTGIDVAASGVTITGSVLGPNTSYGIDAHGGTIQIGGTTGTTPGGPCTGNCNLVIGNASGLHLAGSGTVQGNYVGTTANGGAANANGDGIVVSSGDWTIGGTSAAAANVVSGNSGDGLFLRCTSCSIEGNFIGTNAAGTAALANYTGINMNGGGTMVIGGATSAAGNVISGNHGTGIELSETTDVTIQGNRIGTTLGGAALGNGVGVGVGTGGGTGVHGTLIGSASAAAAANTIAYNASAGVLMRYVGTVYNEVRGNSIHDNGGPGISLEFSANGAIAAPSITGVAPVHGTACPGCAVDIYSDSADEGRIFEGSVTADGSGHWSYPSSVTGPHVTATNTDAAHNTLGILGAGLRGQAPARWPHQEGQRNIRRQQHLQHHRCQPDKDRFGDKGRHDHLRRLDPERRRRRGKLHGIRQRHRDHDVHGTLLPRHDRDHHGRPRGYLHDAIAGPRRDIPHQCQSQGQVAPPRRAPASSAW